MINILYLINHAGKAGTEKYVYNLVKKFNGRETNCFFAYNEPGLLSEQMAELKVPSFNISMKNPFDLAAAKKLAAICRKNKIDVIHTQYPRENYIAILSKLFGSRAKVVYTCHLTYYPPKIWYFINRLVMPFDDKIISVCTEGAKILCEIGAPSKKITVIYNGIDYPTDPCKTDYIKKELGLSDDTFVIVSLSRLSPEKGLDFLIKSMRELKNKTDIPFVCLIAGDGPLKDDLITLVKSLDAESYVRLLGFRLDSAKILESSDVFVNSAKCNEALSFAILEAMGYALPIVATDRGGNPDILKPEHNCGIMIPFDDAASMSDAFLQLMNDKSFAKVCSDGALKTVREVFNLDKLLGDTLNIYHQALL
ncbi:MAG: glycosyltransferase [Clostridia bacterium]|nr:glycosyltransferase [Clostridia bacterium]